MTTDLTKISGIGLNSAKALKEAGFDSIETIAKSTAAAQRLHEPAFRRLILLSVSIYKLDIKNPGHMTGVFYCPNPAHNSLRTKV